MKKYCDAINWIWTNFGYILLSLLALLAFSCEFPRPSHATQETKKIEEPLNLVPLNGDTLINLGLKPEMIREKLQVWSDGQVFGVHTTKGTNSTRIDDKGTLIKTITGDHNDTLLVIPMQKGVVLGTYTDNTMGLVIQIGFDEDATIQNKKFLLYAMDRNKDFRLVLERKEIEYISYWGRRFPVFSGSSGLLFDFTIKQLPDTGTMIKPKGKEVQKPPIEKN